MATDHERDEHGLITLQPGEVYEGPVMDLGEVTPLRAQFLRMKAQRDELLSALKALLEEAESLAFSVDQEYACHGEPATNKGPVFVAARAAITKVEPS